MRRKLKADGMPVYTEHDEFRRSVDRRFRWTNTVMAAITMCALVTAYVAYARPIPVVAFDSQGRGLLFEDTVTPRRRTEQNRIEYFAEYFVRRYVGGNSGTVDLDLRESLNSMTPRLRSLTVEDTEYLAKQARWKDANARTTFDDEDLHVTIGRYDAEDTDARIPVLVTGKMTLEPLFGSLPADSKPVEEFFAAKIELAQVAVSKETIHGLQVNWINVDRFTSRELFEKHFRSKES